MLGFWSYLRSPDPGYMKETERMKLLEHLDPDGKDVTCLVDDNTNAVWEKWVHPLPRRSTQEGLSILIWEACKSSSLLSLQTEESPRVCHIWTKKPLIYSSS